ncbi:hypothetical protein PSPO01_08843 [Paraphaeosphaeria sporulosa]
MPLYCNLSPCAPALAAMREERFPEQETGARPWRACSEGVVFCLRNKHILVLAELIHRSSHPALGQRDCRVISYSSGPCLGRSASSAEPELLWGQGSTDSQRLCGSLQVGTAMLGYGESDGCCDARACWSLFHVALRWSNTKSRAEAAAAETKPKVRPDLSESIATSVHADTAPPPPSCLMAMPARADGSSD